MQNETLLDSIQKYDPNAICLVSSDRRAYYFIKRIFDFCAAILLLVIFAPIMLLIALLIYAYSPGPVFFLQERVGSKRCVNGKYSYWKREEFICIKFRTMKISADPSVHQEYVKALIENDVERMDSLQNGTTQVRKLVNDRRIIRPGYFLRKLSLDELPQFWNVVRGDMSLVGPRPAIPYEVDMYKPWHLGRLEATPGITGLQQVTSRCTTDFDFQVKQDLAYIKKQSFWLDLKIVLLTPLAVFSTKGAY